MQTLVMSNSLSVVDCGGCGSGRIGNHGTEADDEQQLRYYCG